VVLVVRLSLVQVLAERVVQVVLQQVLMVLTVPHIRFQEPLLITLAAVVVAGG
jgi:hypothetical protein